jgi:FimV-like protein
MSRKLCYDHPIIAGVFNRKVFMVTHKVKFAITLLVGFFALIVTSVSVGETPIKVDLKSSSEDSLGPVLGDYRVAKGDTLWKVSERARPEGATVWQTMDAIFIGNPRSFLYDDASKIIINTVIKLPTSEQASIQSGRFVSDELKRTVYLENSDVEAKKFTDAERADGLSEVFVGSSSESLTVLDNTDQEAKSYAVTKTPVDAEDSQLIPYRNEVDVMNAVKVDSVDSLEQDRLRAVAQVELENEALREEVLVLTTKLQALTQPVKLEADTIELVAEKTQIKESNVAIAWIENQPWYIASLLAALATMLGFFVHKSVRREVPVTESTLADIYDEPSQSQVEVTEIVFDETDGDIFAGPDDEANLSGFDLMVDPVSEAEVHLSLGQLKEALDILETARNNDSDDMSSRLKLMEIYLSEELPEPLVALHQEINSSEDEISIKKAELILTSRLQQGQSILQVNEQASMSDTDIGVNITPEDFPEIDGSFDSEVLESMNALEQSQTTDLSDMEYLDEFQDINPVDIKLDLAATYADLGDKQGARAILNEIIADASKADKSRAQAILDQLDL